MNGVAIVTYNRAKYLDQIICGVLDTIDKHTKFVICDDGSTDNTYEVVKKFDIPFITGKNLGVAANKNRALFSLQDCDFIALLEDDLKPVKENWFEMYREVSIYADIHHFCRVQPNIKYPVADLAPTFSEDLAEHDIMPICGRKARGDFTFITKEVLRKVGGLNPKFIGAGFAHLEWQDRIFRAGLIPHPNIWLDLRGRKQQDTDELADPFQQLGDTEGGRWCENPQKIEKQLANNRLLYKKIKKQKGPLKLPLKLY